jgi:hypothetical protein
VISIRLITPTTNTFHFVKIFNINYLYRFYADREDIADNMVKKWNGEVGDPLKVSENLVTLATDLY